MFSLVIYTYCYCSNIKKSKLSITASPMDYLIFYAIYNILFEHLQHSINSKINTKNPP